MLNALPNVEELAYALEAVVDAQFTTRLGLRSLKRLKTPFIGRFRSDGWAKHQAKPSQSAASPIPSR